jgi:glutaredoxin
MKPYLLFASFLLVLANARADGVYRWQDNSGNVYYGDSPAQGSLQVEKKQLEENPGASVELPYETRIANEKFPVVLYVSDNCGSMCSDAREFLDKRGIPYSEKHLSTKQEIESFKITSGGEIVPTISVGKRWVRGFQAENWNSELDVAGYPKTSPYLNPAANIKQPASGQRTEGPATDEPVDVTPEDESPAVETPAVEQ